MIRSLALSVALLLMLSPALAAHRVDQLQALATAEKYVADNQLQDASRHLDSITRVEDPAAPENDCWVIWWGPEPGTFDNLLVVRVYDDGRITYQSSWA